VKVGKKRDAKLVRVAGELESILAGARAFERRYAKQLEQLHPDQERSGLNLLHYLALRQRDVRELQDDLATLGLSSLGRAEAHVLATVCAALEAVHHLRGRKPHCPKPPVSFKRGRKLLRRHTNELLGKKLKGSSIRIMVTLPTDAADDYAMVRDMLAAGMNCARVNCSQDGPEEWERMIANVARARRATGRGCSVFMDLAGPKLRIGALVPGPSILRIKPEEDVRGRVLTPACVQLVPEGNAGVGELERRFTEGPTVPISAELHAALAPGHRLGLVDTRGVRTELRIEGVKGPSARALCPESVYLEGGLELALEGGPGATSRTGVVGALPGLRPEIRLRVGDTLVVHKDPRPGEPARPGKPGQPPVPAHVPCDLPEVFDRVEVGQPLLLDDGKIAGVIREVERDRITVEITRAKPGGTKLRAHKGLNLPETSLGLFGLTDKDREDLRFVASHADGVNVSFVNHPDDVEDLLDEMESVGGEHLGLILKIETRLGFRHLPGILLAAMEWPRVGVMIARGDLAVEGGWTHLAQIQEEILCVCEAAHVPVVWATQVLDRLAKQGLPTRSEISDVMMAERAECVMLNKGPYITRAIRTLDSILKSMQDYQRKKSTLLPALMLEQPDPAEVGRAVGDRQGRWTLP
jgi:pyruvate kinase